MTAAKTKSAPLASHVAPDGSTRMVDVSAKQASLHEATAAARVRVGRAIAAAIRGGAIPKGPVLERARLAGIMAAKLTPSLPLPPAAPRTCQPALKDDAVEIVATARATHHTGVEMEAMTAVAALTVYDMCKSADKGIVIEAVSLLAKSGGKSGGLEGRRLGGRQMSGRVVAVCTGKRKGVQKRPHPVGTRWTLPAGRWSRPGGSPATRAPIGSNRPPGEVWIR